jgi:hypothetical protein
VPSRTPRRGLGPLNDGAAHGLLAHVMMAVDAEDGACLGLVGGAVWNRADHVDTPTWARSLEQRESYRWVATAEGAGQVLADAAQVTVVSDREGDLYPHWARVPALGWHVLGRARVDRKLVDGTMLFAAAAGFPLADTRALDLPTRMPGQSARQARLDLRFGEVTIRRSPNEKDRTLPRGQALTFVEVREVDPPAGAEPVHWRLLTTHRAGDAKAAWRIVGWYRRRWCIEQLFRLLKSQGLELENSQVASAERLRKLAAIAIKAACLILQLVQDRDGSHAMPAAAAFTPCEVDTIEVLSDTLAGRTPRQRNPHPPGSLARATWVAARLGGWNCYGKPPGPITIQRGIQRFHDIHNGRLLSTQPKHVV